MTYSQYIRPKRIQTSIVAALLVVAQLSLGFVGAQSVSADSITNTGYNSDNTVSSTVDNSVTLTNNNYVSVSNSNYQTAVSGDATVSQNTTGGSATSGDASNSNSTSVAVSLTNNSVGAYDFGSPGSNGTISNTGADSSNEIISSFTNTVNVSNNNNVSVSNSNYQTAVSGDATVSQNTTGGSATSGDASNDNCTDINVTINNGAGGASGNTGSACDDDEAPVGGSGQGPTGGSGSGSVLGATTTSSAVGGFGAAGAVLGAQLANTGSEILVALFAALAMLGLVATLSQLKRKELAV